MIAVALTAALTAGAAAANVLVVRSSGPSAKALPAGRSLAPNARFSLRAGDTIVLLDGRGTRTLRGPGTFTAGAAAQVGTRAALSVNNNGRIGRVGATRRVRQTPQRPSIWALDIAQSGTVCVADPRNVTLWRADATRTLNLSIAPAGQVGAARTIEWTAGEATLAWPSDLSISNDAEYRLSAQGVPLPTRLRFRIVQNAPSAIDAQAEAFIRNGCQAQLDTLIETAQRAG